MSSYVYGHKIRFFDEAWQAWSGWVNLFYESCILKFSHLLSTLRGDELSIKLGQCHLFRESLIPPTQQLQHDYLKPIQIYLDLFRTPRHRFHDSLLTTYFIVIDLAVFPALSETVQRFASYFYVNPTILYAGIPHNDFAQDRSPYTSYALVLSCLAV